MRALWAPTARAPRVHDAVLAAALRRRGRRPFLDDTLRPGGRCQRAWLWHGMLSMQPLLRLCLCLGVVSLLLLQELPDLSTFVTGHPMQVPCQHCSGRHPQPLRRSTGVCQGAVAFRHLGCQSNDSTLAPPPIEQV